MAAIQEVLSKEGILLPAINNTTETHGLAGDLLLTQGTFKYAHYKVQSREKPKYFDFSS